MLRRGTKSKPTFFWQGVLIVLPVVVLAAVGFFSLRRDRAIAEAEARELAQLIAEGLVPKAWATIMTDPTSVDAAGRTLGISAEGELVFPPPRAEVPTPQPLDPGLLTAQQAQLWKELIRSTTEESSGSNAEPLQRFLATSPPANFSGAAFYRLGLQRAEKGDLSGASEMFSELLGYDDVVGETGLPLRPLAALKLLQWQTSGRSQPPTNAMLSWDAFCLDAICFPTVLTPHLLEEARCAGVAVQGWENQWEQHELLRRIFATAQEQLQHLAIAGSSNAAPHPGPVATNVTPNAVLEQFWVTLPEPWRTSMTNFASTTANDVAQSMAIQVQEANWFVMHNDEARKAVLLPPRYELQTPKRVRLDMRTRTGAPRDPYDAFPSTTEEARSQLKSRPILRPPRNRNIASLSWDRAADALTDMASNHWFVCRAESEIGEAISRLVTSEWQIPEYFGIGVQLAGRPVRRRAPDLREWHYHHFSGKPGGVRREASTEFATNILASAVKNVSGAELLKVNVYLTSPSALFRRQSARTFWFGSLIGVSAMAALVGLFAAWHAFQRQMQLSEMKSNFVSSVSHELRAPIASVRLLAESLERGKIQEPVKQTEYFRFIGQECRRLSALVENVLDFSRIDQGRKQYEFEPTDVTALVQQTVKLMETYAEERGARLVLSLADSDGRQSRIEASLDGKAIQQALVNLIDNAMKHSPKNGAVTVGLEVLVIEPAVQVGGGGNPPAESNGKRLRLWVEDQGEGIPAEEHEKIFERFYRCGSELRRETQGVGIGLSIVKHIVEGHGGTVHVRSAVGQGSRFTIELPLSAKTEK